MQNYLEYFNPMQSDAIRFKSYVQLMQKKYNNCKTLDGRHRLITRAFPLLYEVYFS